MAEFVGRGLMVALGVYLWIYVLRPDLPIVRALSISSWYRVRSGDPFLRALYGVVGTIFIAVAFVV